MNKKIIIVAVAVAVLAGGYLLVSGIGKNKGAPVPSKNGPVGAKVANTKSRQSAQESKNKVVYTDSGYSPAEIKIKAGETATFKNESSSGLWTASAEHPFHMVYGGTSLQQHCPNGASYSFDECKLSKPGESWSFRFDKKGEWEYHNHLEPSHLGKVIVE